VFAGRGGNVGLVSSSQFNKSTTELRRRWGRYVTHKARTINKTATVAPIGLNVSRHNPTAQR
jgi:hypothetical protein